MTKNCSLNYTNNMPRIAIISGWDGKDYDVHPDYISAVLNAGGFPVFIFYDDVKKQLEEANVAGVLLIGGDFTFPNEWYEPPLLEDVSKRSLAYLKMLDFAKENKLPTLGICAGQQVIACHAGGAKMYNKLNDDLAPEKSHKQYAYKLVHKVDIAPNSLLNEIMQTTETLTNSCHNEAIYADKLGDCIATGVAEDGVIEAVELKKPWNKFVLGVQWHPERMIRINDELSVKLFEAFVKACENVE